MKRREFLKVAAGAAGTGLLLAADAKQALASDQRGEMPAEALGLLYDSGICVGCKACVAACKEANGMPPEFTSPDQLWDDPLDLSAKTMNIIKLYKTGKGLEKDNADDGYAFVKRQCMHCADPGCVSACPASAMTKNPETGIVEYDKGKCIGCRYCQIACPYGIPKYEWDKALPQIRKCELCRTRKDGKKIAACAESCPTGATIYGKTKDLMAEAKRRLQRKPGEDTKYPLNLADSKSTLSRPAPTYVQHVYGEKEAGGTQCLMVSAVPFEKLGLPVLPEKSYAAMSENLQHTLYKGMIAPGALFLGLMGAAYASTKKQAPQDDSKKDGKK